jgi:DNA-binding FadR family transcriptional regulator
LVQKWDTESRYVTRVSVLLLANMIDRSKSRDGAGRLREFLLSGIAEGRLKPGERLPTERALVAQFATARSAARRALARLEAEGRITRTVGRGTFVAGPHPQTGGDRIRPALDSASVSPAELMEARLRFEPEMAEMVATHATAADFERMEHCLERAEKGTTLNDFEIWDAALHEAIARATHNKLVIAVFDMISVVRQQAEWGKLKDRIVTPERRLGYQAQHRKIVEALRRRDADEARLAMTEHLTYARRNLFGR